MKKILIALGGIFIVIVIVAVIGFTFLAIKGCALDEEGKAYVDEVVPIILTDLNQTTLFKYATPELKESATQEEFEKLFKWFKHLGQFKEYKDSAGQATISYTVNKGKLIYAEYVAQVEFETGPATVFVAAVKRNGKWFIHGFHINSKALIK